MADIIITEESIPPLPGKYAVVTGGASGIGLACCNLLASRGAARVYMLDLQPPEHPTGLAGAIQFRRCDVSRWEQLRDTFAGLSRVDMVFANAGRGQGGDPLGERHDINTGELLEPCVDVLGTNYRGALNTAVLGIRAMREHGAGGSVVFTSSATALSSERGLPVYGSLKLALLGLVRGWRTQLIHEGITVNAVAPACTVTGLMPERAARPLADKGLAVSNPEHVARALVFSAVATEARRVEAYAAEKEEDNERPGRWNGRVILTIGERYTEVEETIERLKSQWFGKINLEDTRHGQCVTQGIF